MDAEIVVGRIGRAHGLRGQLVVQPATPGSDILLHVESVTAELAGRRRALAVRDARIQGKLLLLAFDGFADRTAAEALVGATLSIPASSLPPPEEGELYSSDLIGLPVESPTGEALGRISDLESSGERTWLVVENAAGKHLVPFTEPLVRLDLANKRVVVDAPQGLLDGQGE